MIKREALLASIEYYRFHAVESIDLNILASLPPALLCFI